MQSFRPNQALFHNIFQFFVMESASPSGYNCRPDLTDNEQ